jgi:hypothetical protein
VPEAAPEDQAETIFQQIMDIVQAARPDKVEDFSLQCRDFGECSLDELDAKAAEYHRFLLATYGAAIVGEVVPQMVLLLPEYEQRRALLAKAGLLRVSTEQDDIASSEDDPLFADSGSASWRRTAIRL